MKSVAPTCRTRAATGITLVELMVVVTILLLLTVVGIPLLAPNDMQKGRDAALTVTGMVGKILGRAATNGGRNAGLWLEPVNPSADGLMPSEGAFDLFACEPQDPYSGDDPTAALAFIYYGAGLPADTAVVLFSTLTSPNIREFCRASSRIKFGSGYTTEYYFRLLSEGEQASQEPAANPSMDGRFPQPYQTQVMEHGPLQIGYYVRKPLSGNSSYTAHSNRSRLVGDVIVGYLQAIPPSDSGPVQSSGFNEGVPEGATYDKDGNVVAPQEYTAPSGFPAIEAGVPFRIPRPITRSATPPFSMPAGYAVDVAWSTCGQYLLCNSAGVLMGTTPNQLHGIDDLLSNRPMMIMFSQTGQVASLVYHTAKTIAGFETVVQEELPVNSDVYLLVGRGDRAGKPYLPGANDKLPGANWQYPDSRWVRINRASGETLIAEPVLGVTDVYSSQGNARLGIPAARN
jgi:type II secretory pathway pseudopilin PulG